MRGSTGFLGQGEVKINISGCMNACGHHHVGNIGLLGVSKNGADWYQITLGGSTGNHTPLGKVLGPAVGKQNIGRAVEIIIETYIELRAQGESFADGRAFSQARLLRERFSFQGDIHAQGEVLRDQLSFMQRCGVSQFRLAEREDTELALSAFADISKNYQPELKVYAG